MGVIGMRFLSISGKIKKPATNKISINSSPVIEDLEERKTGLTGLEKILAIKFSFKTKYEPNVAEIEMKGEVMYQTKEHEKLLKEWKKEKRLPKEDAVIILNAIFRRCLSKTIGMAEDLQLPPPIRFPVVKAEKKA